MRRKMGCPPKTTTMAIFLEKANFALIFYLIFSKKWIEKWLKKWLKNATVSDTNYCRYITSHLGEKKL